MKFIQSLIAYFQNIRVRSKKYRVRIRKFRAKALFTMQRRVLKNVFKSAYTDKVLISYLPSPFVKGIKASHTNFLECYTAAEVFHELHYQVDVVHFTEPVDGSYLAEYKVVYGFGDAFYQSLRRPEIQSIFYGTGCNPLYSNKVSLERICSFHRETGVLALSSLRYIEEDAQFMLYCANLIIPLGNQFVADTYKVEGAEQVIQPLEGFFYEVYDIDLEQKDFAQAKHNFLWFGSAGLLHKGLDIVLEVFKKRPELNLFICGASRTETEFFQYYWKELNNEVGNIKNLGFLDIYGEEFRKVMDICVGVMLPSVSEGSAPSVLTAMGNGGLIPIVSQAAGLDIDEYGFSFERITAGEVEDRINQVLEYAPGELRDLAKKIKLQTKLKYNYTRYKENLKNILATHLEGL